MTPSDLLTFVRQRYNAVGDSFFSDVELLEVLSMASLELSIEAECIERRYTTASVLGQREYEKPAYSIRIARITYDGQRLDQTDPTEEDFMTGNDSASTSSGVPKFYSVFSDTIFLWPTPSESAKTIEIFSIDEAQRIASISSTLDIPTRYQLGLSDYALYYMAAKDTNTALSEIYHRKWEKRIADAKRFEMKRAVGDKYKTVKPVDMMPYHDIGD